MKKLKNNSQEKWTICKACPDDYLKTSNFNKIEKQLLYNRGLSDIQEVESYLDPQYEKLHDPFMFSGMDRIVEKIINFIDQEKKIVIYGDYDVDGISATAILYETLKKAKANAHYYIPSREDEGYGLNKKALELLKKEEADLIITVDCGISALEEVEYAKSIGLEVIVTDHHAVREENGKQILPKTLILNPKVTGSYSFSDLSGAGVAFKLAAALYKKIPSLKSKSEKWLLDLVALGTICDVVPLVNENRTLAKYGLLVLAKTKRCGLRMLAEVSGINLSESSAYTVGFVFGPRLNAAGRLRTAEKAIKLLLSEDENEARMLAIELHKLNEERQIITQKILEETQKEIAGKDPKSKMFLMSNKNWPKGVIGIVASKLSDIYVRPVIIFEENDEFHVGSARSPKYFNIIEALSKCSDFLVKYGGHSRAAGLTLKREHFVMLEDRLLEISNKSFDEEEMKREFLVELLLDPKLIGEELFLFISKMEPFGNGNPMPVFQIDGVNIIDKRQVGKEGNHMKMVLEKDGKSFNAIVFNHNGDIDTEHKVDLIFYLQKNTWKEKTTYEAKGISIRVAHE